MAVDFELANAKDWHTEATLEHTLNWSKPEPQTMLASALTLSILD